SFSLPQPKRDVGKITAFKNGYLIGSAVPEGGQPPKIVLSRLPPQDDALYRWVDPTPNPARAHNCGNCHEQTFREWSISGHARSATNRHFLNLYNGTDWFGHANVGWSLRADRPETTGVCTPCHAPTMEDLTNPAYDDLAQIRGVPAQGVHCDYCHKIVAADNRKIGLTHGRFGLRLLRPEHGQLFFGPLDDVDRHEDSALAVYRDSRYCASCHEGTVLSVHVYSTYSEWQRSPAAREGKQCQTCHMAPTGKMTNLAPGKGGIERDPQTLANHRFFVGDQASMLRRCLQVKVELKPTPTVVEARVYVRAQDVGHCVPTGFVDHNLVLLVEATDHAGRPLPRRAGPALPKAAGGQLVDQAGRLYARLLHDESSAPVPFWRADPDFEDTRLRPDQTNQSVFTFPPNAAQVRVRLLYRRFWPQVAGSKHWPDKDLVVLDRTRLVSP
ncbi:MAG TPA: multiheme c-type cytochrome, partial [Gemmataceae bacterium]|nr:multiheme c-type cytochrome [Gemmataceae bacterium]